jgi:hypothetical protein
MSDKLHNLVAHNKDDLINIGREAEGVIRKYGTLFHPDNLHHLTPENFHSFLLYENNKHWTGIHRQSSLLTNDMSLLRKVLHILLDESRHLGDRLDEIFPKGSNSMLKGLGRAVATPILHVVYPSEYGVYNAKCENGLKALGLFPDFPRRASFAEQYVAVNNRLLTLSRDLNISLWQLDTLWHWLLQNSDETESEQPQLLGASSEDEQPQFAYFSLELQLSNFLYLNWEKMPLWADYYLYDAGGKTAQEYETEIGRIDLLARSKDHKVWLIIELKKGRSSDAVVGQILRYMGWVRANLANENEEVRGIIILGEADEKIRYALEAANADIHLYQYKIDFALTQMY